jgi:hypothetical protein
MEKKLKEVKSWMAQVYF